MPGAVDEALAGIEPGLDESQPALTAVGVRSAAEWRAMTAHLLETA